MSATLLLVEDNPLNADMLSRRLIKRGYVVRLAGDGLRAVECAQADPPNLILMDISLPKIDGLEATRRVKACPATAWIPVIALTAHAMVSDRATSLAAGCDEFETKPVDLTRLVEKIERLLAATGAAG